MMILYEEMDFVEKLLNFLNLIYQDKPGRGWIVFNSGEAFFTQQRRPDRVFGKTIRVQ
jgi:hypothetical protein